MAEMRDGYWTIVFHSGLSSSARRGFISYFKSADNYVVELGGDSMMGLFNATLADAEQYESSQEKVK